MCYLLGMQRYTLLLTYCTKCVFRGVENTSICQAVFGFEPPKHVALRNKRPTAADSFISEIFNLSAFDVILCNNDTYLHIDVIPFLKIYLDMLLYIYWMKGYVLAKQRK